MIIHTPNLSHCPKAIGNSNKMVIARPMTKRWPNIPSNNSRFDISVDWEMLREEFETWPMDPILNATLVIVCMHVIDVWYLDEISSHFTELSDGTTEKTNK